jgi:hypothetical protein
MRKALTEYLSDMVKQGNVGEFTRFFALEPDQMGPDVSPQMLQDLQLLTKAHSIGFPSINDNRKK